jgi:hypothetical protein
MELQKQPQTEMEYWQCIEGLGGFAWRMNHDLADGRISDPDGSIDKKIVSAREISTRLVQEIAEKFNVIPPDQMPKRQVGESLPPAPEGKIYYWDWYHKWQREFYQGLYDKIICSACPMSEGVDRFIGLNQIPCSVFPGALYHLRANHQCGMLGIRHGEWTTQRLHSAIFNKCGKEALAIFKAKQAALKAAPEPPV